MEHPFHNPPERKPETKSTSYTEQFEEYVREAKKNGMIYMNIYYGEGYNKDTVEYEKFCEEFIGMVNAPTLSDEEVLGKYGKF